MIAGRKPSSVDWVADIPASWDIIPLTRCCTERREKNTGNREANVLSLSYGNIVQRNVDSNEGLLPASFETYQIVNPGNIILRLTDLQNDKRSLRVGRVTQRGIITSAYVCLGFGERLDDRFGYFLLHSYDKAKVFYSFGGGVRQSMKFEDFKTVPLFAPPLPTQKAIADFLDKKTAAIDALIEKKQKLLTLLAEKRAALINQAVTKGLDPNVPMKDSGIPWIGEIPAHWEVKKLSWLLHDGPRNGVSPAVSNDGTGVASFSISVIRNGVVEVRQSDVKLVGASSSDVDRFNVQKDDLLLVRGNGNIGLVGATGLVLDDKLSRYVYPDLLMRMRCNEATSPSYLRYCINSDIVRPQLTAAARTTVGTYKVNNEQVRELRVLAPPKSEATSISAYLDRLLGRHTRHAKIIHLQLERLKEYRQAVITAAVTGQLDIEEAA